MGVLREAASEYAGRFCGEAFRGMSFGWPAGNLRENLRGKPPGKTLRGKPPGENLRGKLRGENSGGKTPVGKNSGGKTSGGKPPGENLRGKPPGENLRGKTSGGNLSGKTFFASRLAPAGQGAPPGIENADFISIYRCSFSLVSLYRFAIPTIRFVPAILNDLCSPLRSPSPCQPRRSLRQQDPTGQRHSKLSRTAPGKALGAVRGKSPGKSPRKKPPEKAPGKSRFASRLAPAGQRRAARL